MALAWRAAWRGRPTIAPHNRAPQSRPTVTGRALAGAERRLTPHMLPRTLYRVSSCSNEALSSLSEERGSGRVRSRTCEVQRHSVPGTNAVPAPRAQAGNIRTRADAGPDARPRRRRRPPPKQPGGWAPCAPASAPPGSGCWRRPRPWPAAPPLRGRSPVASMLSPWRQLSLALPAALLNYKGLRVMRQHWGPPAQGQPAWSHEARAAAVAPKPLCSIPRPCGRLRQDERRAGRRCVQGRGATPADYRAGKRRRAGTPAPAAALRGQRDDAG